jgi:mycothiol S-conjugate amidase
VTLRLLAVHAHPDDESSKGAATYAYYRSRGVDVCVVSCTGGERGDVQNSGLEPMAHADRDMAGLRRLEMQAAQAAMGIDHRWLGFMDSGLPENGEALQPQSFAMIPLELSGPPLVKVIRELRPQVLVTYDENGGYPHPDHIRAHQISIWAMEAAADPERFPELGAAWTVSKLYYDRILNPMRMNAIYEAMVATQPENPLLTQMAEMRGWLDQRESLHTTQVPAIDFFDVRDVALKAHASQVPPDSFFFFWPNELQRAAWPYEDFQLVSSLVPTTLPETDLFAGIIDEDSE